MTNGEPNQARATNISLGAAFVALVNSIVAAFTAFGLDLTAAQQASITGLCNAVVLFLLAAVHVYTQLTAERERWSHLDSPEDGAEAEVPRRRPPS